MQKESALKFKQKKKKNDTYFGNIWHRKAVSLIFQHKLFTIIYHYINYKLPC